MRKMINENITKVSTTLFSVNTSNFSSYNAFYNIYYDGNRGEI